MKDIKEKKYTQVKLQFDKKTKFVLSRNSSLILKGECRCIVLTLPVGEYQLAVCDKNRKKIRFLLLEDRCEIIS